MVSYEYIAGFFDGEGYIQIAKKAPNSHSGAPYWLTASMANTHKGVLEEIQKVIGNGKVIFHQGTNGWKTHYRLTFYTLQALNFIKLIEPYLIIKKEEARLAIEFAEHLKSRHYGLKLTEEELTVRHDYYLKMKSLKGNRGADKEYARRTNLS